MSVQCVHPSTPPSGTVGSILRSVPMAPKLLMQVVATVCQSVSLLSCELLKGKVYSIHFATTSAWRSFSEYRVGEKALEPSRAFVFPPLPLVP